MKEAILVLLVFNVAFSSAIFLGHRLKRSSDNEFNSSFDFPGATIPKSHFFAQKLDHFNPADDRKWNQRYKISQNHFREGGAAFLIANGAWAVDYDDEDMDNDPIIGSFAKELNAIIFSIEHRFYGKSWPTKEDKHYFSSIQAVADIANFIKSMTKIYKLPKDTKWIAIGCSYGGKLATWARLKYPHLIHGTFASSAPILAKLDYYEFHQSIDETLKSYDQKCFDSITLLTEEIARFINSTENIQNILEKLNLCDNNIKNTADLATVLLNDMIAILSASVANNNPTTQINIASTCKLVMNHNLTKLEIFNKLKKGYEKYKNSVTDDSFNKYLALWFYQSCSEFGRFSSHYQKNPLFVLSQMIPIETEIKKKCGKFYGPNFGAKVLGEKVRQSNLLYGGLDIDIGNIVFTHGSLDPWHTAGLYQKKEGALYETIFINGTSHCSDLSYSDSDPPQLKAARVKVLNMMKDWLQK